MSRKRLNYETRHKQLLAASVRAAAVHGYRAVTSAQVAAEADVSHQLVVHYLGTMGELRTDTLLAAIECENLGVIAQALAVSDPLVEDIPEELRKRAARSIQ